MVVADGLTAWAGRRFAAVVGNPPFLGQPAASYGRAVGGRPSRARRLHRHQCGVPAPRPRPGRGRWRRGARAAAVGAGDPGRRSGAARGRRARHDHRLLVLPGAGLRRHPGAHLRPGRPRRQWAGDRPRRVGRPGRTGLRHPRRAPADRPRAGHDRDLHGGLPRPVLRPGPVRERGPRRRPAGHERADRPRGVPVGEGAHPLRAAALRRTGGRPRRAPRRWAARRLGRRAAGAQACWWPPRAG
ncbi:hypothetical protein [Nocardioides convexus]|uniref:hypothetical protein n=1 Tax=Nocardioides convexus TaxID=2712224 RepID=UPI002418A64B|nr:hypothetical protein [Nocardioides convexus]